MGQAVQGQEESPQLFLDCMTIKALRPFKISLNDTSQKTYILSNTNVKTSNLALTY
jgi:hypothetical protein